MNKKQKKVLIRIIVAVALLIILSFVPAEGWLQLALYMIPYLVMALIYIVLVLLITLGIHLMERSLKKSDRRH